MYNILDVKKIIIDIYVIFEIEEMNLNIMYFILKLFIK